MKKISFMMLSVFFMNASMDEHITDSGESPISVITPLVENATVSESGVNSSGFFKYTSDVLSSLKGYAESAYDNVDKYTGLGISALRNGTAYTYNKVNNTVTPVIRAVSNSVNEHPCIYGLVVGGVVLSAVSYTLYKYVTNKTSKAAIAIPSAVNGVANSDVMKLSEGNQPVVAAEERKPIRIKRMVAVSHPNSIINAEINMALKNNDVSVFKRFPQYFKEVEVVEYR